MSTVFHCHGIRTGIIIRDIQQRYFCLLYTSVCGLGFYEFSLNGKKVGNSEFAPLWSDYDKTVYYNTYDVTEQLRRGENVVGILLL